MSDLEGLQGTWRFVALEIEGAKLPANVYDGAKIIIEGERFTSIMGDAVYAGGVSLNADARPKTIDLNFTDGPEAGKASLAIYELDGDEWTICLGFAGRDRPERFLTTPGCGHALEKLRRAV